MTKAVIFDMDGVLVRSETWWLKSLADLVTFYGGHVPDDMIHELGGCSMEEECEFVAEQLQIPRQQAEKLRRQWHKDHPIDYRPLLNEKVIPFINDLKARNIKTAIASSSPFSAICQMTKECDLEHSFDLVVSGEQFVQSKPNPEIYLYTVAQLHVPPEEVMVIEDSPRGIQAAKAAHLACIALYDPETDFDTSQADATVDSFSSITI